MQAFVEVVIELLSQSSAHKPWSLCAVGRYTCSLWHLFSLDFKLNTLLHLPPCYITTGVACMLWCKQRTCLLPFQEFSILFCIWFITLLALYHRSFVTFVIWFGQQVKYIFICIFFFIFLTQRFTFTYSYLPKKCSFVLNKLFYNCYLYFVFGLCLFCFIFSNLCLTAGV